MAHCRFMQALSPKQFLFLEKYVENSSRYLDSYENLSLLGDFNMTPEGKSLQHFIDTL